MWCSFHIVTAFVLERGYGKGSLYAAFTVSAPLAKRHLRRIKSVVVIHRDFHVVQLAQFIQTTTSGLLVNFWVKGLIGEWFGWFEHDFILILILADHDKILLGERLLLHGLRIASEFRCFCYLDVHPHG